jgi:type IV pilus assembly protein PilO
MNNRQLTFWLKRLNSPLGLHVAAVAVLAILVAFLAVRFAFDWSAARGGAADVLANKQLQWRTLELQNQPLRGLEPRVEATRNQIDAFYKKRIPANYSVIAARIGEVQVHAGARLTRVQYTPQPSNADLTEIVLDVAVSGDYKQIMHFVNGLEREQTFFVIRAMALNEQQGGMVNLRLRLSTWLRPADAAALPPSQPSESSPSNQKPTAKPARAAKEGM